MAQEGGIAPDGSGDFLTRADRRALIALCVLLVGAGALHFVVPGPYRRIIPAPLRAHAAALVAMSGVGEIACAALLAIPHTRRLGAFAAAVLFVAVLPANVQMALDVTRAEGATLLRVAVWLRLPLQIPLILWALRYRRASPRQGERITCR